MELKEAVEHLIEAYGGLRAACRALDMDPGYFWRMRVGLSTNPSDEILLRMGLRRKIDYEWL